MKPTRSVEGVLLFPGAGTDSNHSSLIRLEQSLHPLPVRRADFAYRKAGKRAPDRAPILLDAVRSEASDFAFTLKTRTAKLVLGGRSMGGRMCSMAVAGGDDVAPLPAAGLILISYPLHPPGNADKLRVEHLPRICVPCLLIQGTRDAFGSPEELLRWTSTIAGPVTHMWVEAKSHDLKDADDAIAAAVGEWLPTIV